MSAPAAAAAVTGQGAPLPALLPGIDDTIPFVGLALLAAFVPEPRYALWLNAQA